MCRALIGLLRTKRIVGCRLGSVGGPPNFRFAGRWRRVTGDTDHRTRRPNGGSGQQSKITCPATCGGRRRAASPDRFPDHPSRPPPGTGWSKAGNCIDRNREAALQGAFPGPTLSLSGFPGFRAACRGRCGGCAAGCGRPPWAGGGFGGRRRGTWW